MYSCEDVRMMNHDHSVVDLARAKIGLFLMDHTNGFGFYEKQQQQRYLKIYCFMFNVFLCDIVHVVQIVFFRVIILAPNELWQLCFWTWFGNHWQQSCSNPKQGMQRSNIAKRQSVSDKTAPNQFLISGWKDTKWTKNRFWWITSTFCVIFSHSFSRVA